MLILLEFLLGGLRGSHLYVAVVLVATFFLYESYLFYLGFVFYELSYLRFTKTRWESFEEESIAGICMEF